MKTRWLSIYLGLFREQPLKESTQCLLGNAVYSGPGGVCLLLVGSERCLPMQSTQTNKKLCIFFFFQRGNSHCRHLLYIYILNNFFMSFFLSIPPYNRSLYSCFVFRIHFFWLSSCCSKMKCFWKYADWLISVVVTCPVFQTAAVYSYLCLEINFWFHIWLKLLVQVKSVTSNIFADMMMTVWIVDSHWWHQDCQWTN